MLYLLPSNVGYQEKKASGKSEDSNNLRESAPPDPRAPLNIASQLYSKKDKQAPKKREGKVEKLLADQTVRLMRHALAKEKAPLRSRSN